MVLVFFAIASIVHFVYLAWQRSRGGGGANKGLQISLLARSCREGWTLKMVGWKCWVAHAVVKA